MLNAVGISVFTIPHRVLSLKWSYPFRKESDGGVWWVCALNLTSGCLIRRTLEMFFSTRFWHIGRFIWQSHRISPVSSWASGVISRRRHTDTQALPNSLCIINDFGVISGFQMNHPNSLITMWHKYDLYYTHSAYPPPHPPTHPRQFKICHKWRMNSLQL